MEPIISGIQQVGVGIPDVHKAYNWFADVLGFDVPIFDDPGTADKMLPYTGGQPQSRHAVLAMNMQGGGGLEIWQYTSRTPQPADFEIKVGDLGINIVMLKTRDIQSAFNTIKNKNAEVLGDIGKMPEGVYAFTFKDPYGNMYRIEESGDAFMHTPAVSGGVIGAVIGAVDMEESIRFYWDILGYDEIIYDYTGRFDDFDSLPGGKESYRRVLLGHKDKRKGAFSRLLGDTHIELVQAIDRQPVKIFDNRFWGDLGFIHLCFDIRGMKELRKKCEKNGYPFTVDSNPNDGTFDMGEAAGQFAYVEDPGGTLVEFVEAEKVPIMKKFGWYLDLKKRDACKPLPDWMLKTLRWNRKHDI